MKSLNDWAKPHGLCFARKGGSNKRNGVYTWWAIYCDRDRLRPHRGANLRTEMDSIKTNCSWKANASALVSKGNK